MVKPGQKYGNWLVLSFAGRKHYPKGSHAIWTCQCVCGIVRPVIQSNLVTGKTQGCGCTNKNKIHGESARGRRSLEYRVWRNMQARCSNPRHTHYALYGGRGIEVCERWRHDFAAFLADMGRRPSKEHTIDRIDNNRGYEPDNCRWATRQEQMLNQRKTLLIGGKIPLASLARLHGIPRNRLRYRILAGWTLIDALTRPVQQ